MERRYKHVISHQSIENYILELSKELKYTPLASRGYLLFDVQLIWKEDINTLYHINQSKITF